MFNIYLVMHWIWYSEDTRIIKLMTEPSLRSFVDKISEVRVMVLNATFNNISVISWRSVLLVEDLEKTSDLPQVPETWTTLLHNVVSSTSCWYRVKWAPGQFDTCLNSQIVRLFWHLVMVKSSSVLKIIYMYSDIIKYLYKYKKKMFYLLTSITYIIY
jgi:hypothetical protein